MAPDIQVYTHSGRSQFRQKMGEFILSSLTTTLFLDSSPPWATIHAKTHYAFASVNINSFHAFYLSRYSAKAHKAGHRAHFPNTMRWKYCFVHWWKRFLFILDVRCLFLWTVFHWCKHRRHQETSFAWGGDSLVRVCMCHCPTVPRPVFRI